VSVTSSGISDTPSIAASRSWPGQRRQPPPRRRRHARRLPCCSGDQRPVAGDLHVGDQHAPVFRMRGQLAHLGSSSIVGTRLSWGRAIITPCPAGRASGPCDIVSPRAHLAMQMADHRRPGIAAPARNARASARGNRDRARRECGSRQSPSPLSAHVSRQARSTDRQRSRHRAADTGQRRIPRSAAAETPLRAAATSAPAPPRAHLRRQGRHIWRSCGFFFFGGEEACRSCATPGQDRRRGAQAPVIVDHAEPRHHGRARFGDLGAARPGRSPALSPRPDPR
jgi:hypothetical protein